MKSAKWWHYLFGAISFLVPLGIYVRTITPTVPFWDSGEFIATSYILGLPHPPGNPVYTMLGRMMTLLPFATIAVRVNFMSSLASALTVLFTFLFTTRALRRTFPGGPATTLQWLSCELGGLVAAFFLTFVSAFWDSAIEAEVYSLSSCMIAGMLWLSFNWWDRLGERGNDNLLVLIVYLLAVSTGVHLGTILVAPGLLVLFWMVRPSYFTTGKFWAPSAFLLLLLVLSIVHVPLPILGLILAAGVLVAAMNHRFYFKNNLATWWIVFAVVGITVQLFLLVRSELAPAINEGSPSTLGSWLEYLSRKQYGPTSPFVRRAEVWYQINHMYLRYVGQQFHLINGMGQLDLSSFWVRAVNAIPFLLFFIGAWWNYRRDKITFWTFAVIHVIMGPALIFYLNFTDHEVREREYFFTNSYHFMAVWMGMGATAVYQALAGLFVTPEAEAERVPAARPVAATAVGTPGGEIPPLAPLPKAPSSVAGLALGAAVLLGISLLPGRAGWYTHDRRNFYIAHDYAYNMLEPLEPNAVVFTNGDNDTFPLWYIQEVEGVRKDVRVVNLSLLNTPWYIKQLRDQDPKLPISFTDAQLETLQPYQDEKTGKVVWVKDLAVADMIKTNQWKRPLYLAVTVPDQMGLESRLTLEGLVFRVNPTETGRQIDVDKTLHNLYSVFQYRGLLDKNRAFDPNPYKDDNAFRLVQNYTAAYVQVAYQLHQEGKVKQAISVLSDAAKISPDFPGVLEYLGRLYEEDGDTEAAERTYTQGMNRDPSAPEYHFHLGVLYYQTGRVEEGITELRRAAQLNQQYFDWFSALFTALWNVGRYEEAVDVLRAWMRAHPEDVEGAGYLKQYEESLRVLTRQPAHAPAAPRGGTSGKR
jgi:hypothetical protein